VRLLLDTHVAVWSVSSSKRLPDHVIALLADRDNEVFVSVVSLWEIALKNTKRARDPMPFSSAVGAFRFTEFSYTSLGLMPTHIFRFEHLDIHHSDPFDRLLVAQALVEQLTIVTHDANMRHYTEAIVAF
jgi:PIN domain nuclease of toxin-antitoxin system